MDGVALESRADHDQVVISDPISEHVLVISMNDNVNRVVFIVSFFKVLNEGVVRLEASLRRLLLIEGNDVAFDQLSEVFNLLLATINVLLLLLLLHLLLLLLLHLLLLHLIIIDLRLLLNFHHLLQSLFFLNSSNYIRNIFIFYNRYLEN